MFTSYVFISSWFVFPSAWGYHFNMFYFSLSSLVLVWTVTAGGGGKQGLTFAIVVSLSDYVVLISVFLEG